MGGTAHSRSLAPCWAGGNKHIDLRHAPKVEPNPRMALMASKAPEWNASKAQLQPYDAGMYTSTAKGAWGKGC